MLREFARLERPAGVGGLGSTAQMVEVSSIAAAADAREAGELFEYSFSSPVTVKQGESAMLPFLQQKIGARKLLVYAENYGLNPRDAAELTNNTGKTLDGGPITVYDAGSYAGEALVETLPMGDKRLISYGVDLGHARHHGVRFVTGGGARDPLSAGNLDGASAPCRKPRRTPSRMWTRRRRRW